MELTNAERLILLQLLPEKGNFLTLKLTRVLQEELSFSEEEHKELKFVQDGEQVRWSENGKTKDCNIGETMENTIKEKFKELDEKEELMPQYFTLYEKFMGE